MLHLTKKDVADIVIESGGKYKFAEVEAKLIARGHKIEPLPKAMTAHQPAAPKGFHPVFSQGKGIANLIPSLAAMAGGIGGGALGGVPGGLLGAAGGGAVGAGIQRGLYAAGGPGEPESGMVARLGEEHIPGFAGLPFELKEGTSQMAQELTGRGIGGALKYGGKKAAELITGFANLRYDPAKTAISEGIAFSRRGLQKIRHILSQVAPQVEQGLTNSPMTGKFQGYNQGVWMQQDIFPEAMAHVDELVARSKDTQAEVWVRQLFHKKMGHPSNQGPLSAARLHELSLAGPGVGKVYKGRTLGRPPELGEHAYWKKIVDEAISNRARAILHQAHPELVPLLERESNLLNLSGHISGHIARPARTIVGHAVTGSVGGAIGGLVPAENRIERTRNILAGLTMGGVISNPDILRLLANTLGRQGPRATAAAVDAIDQ